MAEITITQLLEAIRTLPRNPEERYHQVLVKEVAARMTIHQHSSPIGDAPTVLTFRRSSSNDGEWALIL